MAAEAMRQIGLARVGRHPDILTVSSPCLKFEAEKSKFYRSLALLCGVVESSFCVTQCAGLTRAEVRKEVQTQTRLLWLGDQGRG